MGHIIPTAKMAGYRYPGENCFFICKKFHLQPGLIHRAAGKTIMTGAARQLPKIFFYLHGDIHSSSINR
jgi:hypothetical protein